MNRCSSLKTTSSAGISGTANRPDARAVEASRGAVTDRAAMKLEVGSEERGGALVLQEQATTPLALW
jgi:hypothetical protein